MMYGIDISNWQGGFDVRALPSDVKFVICKISEGCSFKDWTAQKFIHDAAEKKLKWGFYHFAQGQNPEMEAEWFVECAREYFNHGIPILDYEVNAYYGGMSESQWCEAFMKRIYELTGCWCMLYTYAAKKKVFEGSWITERCPLWLAGYPGTITKFSHMEPQYTAYPWDYISIWQFTSSLKLDGIPYSLDGDIAYFDEEDWEYYFGGEADMATPEEIAEHVWGYNYKNTIRGGGTIYDEVAAIYDMVLELIEEIDDLKDRIENGER